MSNRNKLSAAFVLAAMIAIGNGQAIAQISLTPPQHFEMRTALLLQEMIKDDLALTDDQKRAVDLVFADFYKCTAEKLPRPVFIAYSMGNSTQTSGADADVVEVEGGNHIEGAIRKDTGGQQVTLVGLLLEKLPASKHTDFRTTLARWNAIKPMPIAMPLVELMRATRDPRLNLTKTEAAKLEKSIKTNAKLSGTLRTARDREQANESYQKILEIVRKQLSEQQMKQLEETIAYLNHKIENWQALKTGGVALYEQSLKLLADEEAKKASAKKPTTGE